ncbi:hypothetical protein BGX28_008892 [Mortierella sp. GBA30]|nr:hypothetical protein BGX28_008892 [Mortierella sp. GBA30]
MAFKTGTGNSQAWMLAASMAAIGMLYQGVSAAAGDGEAGSCAPCGIADTILKPCNSSLGMSGWPACLTCQSSDTAHLSVKPLADYKLVCQSLGVTAFPAILIPGQSQSTSAPAPTDSNTSSGGSSSGSTGGSHSSLPSGAIAGIIVSAIALIVALSVAGYVFTKRKRDLARQQEEDELYKYQETNRNSYIEAPLPQYTGMIQSSLPQLPQLTNLRVMNPDNEDDDAHYYNKLQEPNFPKSHGAEGSSFEVHRNSPGWRRGSFDDD